MPRAEVDVGAVLGRLGIEARRRGREWTAKCPNREHDDRKPSWRMRDEPGSERHSKHNCFACGFGGTVEDLVMHLLGLSWGEAKDWLEGSAVPMSKPVAASVEVKVRSSDRGFRMPVGVEFGPLAAWPRSARTYWEVERGLTAEMVERWGVGFAVEGRLAGRVVFPKRDERGVLGGYSARTFVGDKRRYLEAEPWERPRAVVFGEERWGDRRSVYLTEGAINALAVERALAIDSEFPNVAAVSGSQLGPLAAMKLASFRGIVLVTDPDAAGDKLAASVETMLSRHEVAIRRVKLPPGKDAASLPVEALREALS